MVTRKEYQQARQRYNELHAKLERLERNTSKFGAPVNVDEQLAVQAEMEQLLTITRAFRKQCNDAN